MKEHTQEALRTTQEQAPPTREEQLLRTIEAALMCLGEGNTARAVQVLYNALPQARRPLR